MTLTPLVTGGGLGHTRGTVSQEVSNPVVQFGGVEVDMRLREVRRGRDAVRLQEQPFQLLALMLDRPGDVVTREDIRQRLWPDGTSVDFEHSVNAVVKRLRAVLGDDAAQPRFVETLPRQGYRFIGELEGADLRLRQPAPAPRPRLVVLPFMNLTGDPSHDYFIDGFTEELIAQLGHRCADRVGILARTSAMLYKDARRGAADIGEALRVDYLVEGSVRVGGDRVRITAQLIETRGETHLWAHSYDRQYSNCLAVQSEVAAEIAVALNGELFPPPTAETPTRVPGAYEAYLTGRFHWNRSGPAGLETAITFYDQALGHDPGFGRAHSSRARALLSLSEYYVVPPGDTLRAARDAAGRALAIDPDDPDAWVVIGETRRVLDHDSAGARAAYEKVLARNASSECAQRYYAWFLAARRPGAEAIAVADRAFSLDPLCIVMQTCAADVHFLARDYEGALSRSRHALAMDPESERARRSAALALVQLGRADDAVAIFDTVPERSASLTSLALKGCALVAAGQADRARAIARRLERRSRDGIVSPYHLAALYTALGDADAAFAQLARACAAGDPWLDAVCVDPRFDSLRGDDRLRAIRARLGLD
jgi:TolB-like protein/tetratricopeptide (TPR) repeat protein